MQTANPPKLIHRQPVSTFQSLHLPDSLDRLSQTRVGCSIRSACNDLKCAQRQTEGFRSSGFWPGSVVWFNEQAFGARRSRDLGIIQRVHFTERAAARRAAVRRRGIHAAPVPKGRPIIARRLNGGYRREGFVLPLRCGFFLPSRLLCRSVHHGNGRN